MGAEGQPAGAAPGYAIVEDRGRPRASYEGKATAYVCENHVCKAPVTTVAELEALLGSAAE